MKVLITGGTGFLGLMLARRLLLRGELTGRSGKPEPVDSLVLFDAVVPPRRPDGLDSRAEILSGDISDAGLVASLVDRPDISVFHLASMVSYGSELDFDGAMRVNLDGGRRVLEACRHRAEGCRLVFTSSIAAFGGDAMPEVVTDNTKLTPETTYGTTKAICELLVNDYARKGFVDGRTARLPTVVIRPGRPNAAASSWVSGIFREPLNGEECVVPVELTTRVPLSGYRTVVENLIRLHELDSEGLGNDRALNLPGLDVTGEEMIVGLRNAADRTLGPINVRPDPAIMRIYKSWATRS
ncbi:MAG TPA: D-erythronate dehydrogenase, partial [Acidimicrobiales bacterium]|nr:D-erythronate dehydrogenase [Acidimicrobiales bacterium]